MRNIFLFFIFTTLVFGADSSTAKQPGLKIGSAAPGCYAKTLDGKDFFLSRHVGPKAKTEFKGPVVFSFFTTTCLPCRKEIPFLHTLHEEYSGVSIYLVNVGEDPEKVERYRDKMNYTLPILIDRYGKLSSNYCAKVTPTLVAISPDGKIDFFKTGFTEADTSSIKEMLARIKEQNPDN